jgi:hypothetical protein
VPPISPTKVPAKLPDLKISNIFSDPAPTVVPGSLHRLNANQPYEFYPVITNLGPGVVPGNVAVRVDYSCTGDCTAVTGALGQFGWSVTCGPPSIGQTVSCPPTTITPKGPGTTWNIVFTVDPDNIYQETDESDSSNVKILTVLVQ